MTARGFTLATILFALLLLGAVVTGAYMAAYQSVRSGRLAQGETATRLAAAGALARAVSAWDVTLDSLGVGNSAVRVTRAGAIVESLSVRRTSENIFALSASAHDTALGARRALLAFATALPIMVRPKALLRLRHPPSAGLTALADSADRAPAGWNCTHLRDTVTTVTVQSMTHDSVFFRFGTTWDWARLSGWIQSLPTGGDSLAWRFESSSATLNGERFTGVLVVDGDLILRQSELIGIVIVRGAIHLEWPGAAISGAIIADEIVHDSLVPSGNIRLQYSSCAVRLAGRSRAPARALRGVAPADLF